MWFVLKKVLAAVLLPPTSCVLLGLLGLWLARWHRRTGLTLAGLSLLSVLLLAWPPVSDALVRSSERAYPAITPEQLARAQAIVVLGGGGYTMASDAGQDVLGPGARERARYAAQLQRQTGLPILATGASPAGMRPEAQVMKDVIEREFRGRVRWVEPGAVDTEGNAALSAPLLRAAGVQRIALVTHGWHQRRAVALFARQGLEVLPAPMGLRPPRPRKLSYLLPRASALADSSLALHEWLGALVQGGLWALRAR